MADSEKTLVLAARNGDPEAREKLVEQYRKNVLGEALRLTANEEDAEDICQEAFLKAFQKLEDLGEPYNFGGWVRVIARNLAHSSLKRKALFVVESIKGEGSTAQYPADEPSWERNSEAALDALSLLSSKLRETARLTYLSNQTGQKVAERLGIPSGTVKRRLWESRTLMRKEVMKMSAEGRVPAGVKRAPVITVEEARGDDLAVVTLGPGLYFGSILEKGRTETATFYDYPGGIPTLTATTSVEKEQVLDGDRCFEVLTLHSDCEPPVSNVVNCFTVKNDGYHWVLSVVADNLYPAITRFGDAAEVFPSEYRTGKFNSYTGETVNLTVGDRNYGRVLSVLWGTEGGTPAESFFTPQGRQVLHRRYVAPDAPDSSNYNYGNLDSAHTRNIDGKECRLWYDTVLSGE